MNTTAVVLLVGLAIFLIAALIVVKSFHSIGPASIGLVNKRLARKSLSEGRSGMKGFSMAVATQGSFGFSANLVSFSTG